MFGVEPAAVRFVNETVYVFFASLLTTQSLKFLPKGWYGTSRRPSGSVSFCSCVKTVPVAFGGVAADSHSVLVILTGP